MRPSLTRERPTMPRNRSPRPPAAPTVAIILLAGWALCPAAPADKPPSPFSSPADAALGAQMFRSHCVTCHGRSGTGGRGPDLTRGEFRYADSDAGLFKIINDGIPRTGMPGLTYARSEHDIWRIVAYVRSLSRRTADAPPRGDPAAGRKVFQEQGDCGTCHSVGGEGGRQGPDLSEIGWLRGPDFLRASILKPDEHVAPRWWRLRLTLEDGTVVEGFRMDEDTFSVRILDSGDSLRSFLKKDLRGLERLEESAMPSFEGAFTDRELDDLVAYLSSLRRKGR